MFKGFLPPILAVVGGVVGFGLRKWQLATGFAPDTGLTIPNAPAAIVLMAWSILLGAVLIALCWKRKERMGWDRAFAGARGNTLFTTAVVLSAFLLLASAGAEAVSFSVNYQTMGAAETFGAQAAAAALPPLRILLCLAGLPCTVLWVKNLNAGKGKGKESLALLELCFLGCVWLISDYKARASDPVVQNYLYEVLAIVCALIGLYYVTSYSFQEGKPRRALFFCHMGTYFSLVTLADRHGLADLFRYGFVVLFLTAHTVLLLQEHPAPRKTENDPDPLAPEVVEVLERLEREADDHAE